MERLTLTEEDQAAIAAWRAENEHDPVIVVDGTNLKIDDHLQIDNSWCVVVLAGDGGGAVQSYIPAWSGLIMDIDLVAYITDRAGPNGETMPIRDEVAP